MTMAAQHLAVPWKCAGYVSSRCSISCWLHEALHLRRRGAGVRYRSQSTRTAATSTQPLPVADFISSPANPYIKHCIKLRDNARYRQQQRRVLLVGRNLLQELAAAQQGVSAAVVFLREGAQPPPAGVAAQATVEVSAAVMDKLAGLEEAAGVDLAAELPLPPPLQLGPTQPGVQHSPQQEQQQQQQQSLTGSQEREQDAHLQQQALQQPRQLQQLQRLLVLEGVQDPGNMGTLLRCATAFGWDAAWLLPGCCDPFNDKALRASRGAALRLPLASGTWQQLEEVARQQGMLLLAAEPSEDVLGGVSAPQEGRFSQQEQTHAADDRDGGTKGVEGLQQAAVGASLQALQHRQVALVLGAEGQGLSRTALSVCKPVTIPMMGDMESLNVGIAGGILMFMLSGGLQPMLSTLGHLAAGSPSTVHVEGSVAAIKLPLLCQLLLQHGNLKVVATKSAKMFPTGQLPVTVLGDEEEWRDWQQVGDPVLHIELRHWADVFVVAPLSANTLAKMANGICDNLLTCVVRAWDFSKPLLVAPAMNTLMWQSSFTKQHLGVLTGLGAQVIPPVSKKLACGDVGVGAMAAPEDITAAVVAALDASADALRHAHTPEPAVLKGTT